MFGLDLKVNMKVRYQLIEKATGKTLLDERVTESYTAIVSDSFFAVEILRLANEEAAKANIGQLIEKLCKLRII